MITTHVLDLAKGRPAAGVRVTLEFLGEGWERRGEGVTDADGRCRTLLSGPLAVGTWRLVFDTGAYCPEGFFPEAALVFAVRDATQHHHVPLLFSPFGYSTYRGS